MAHGALAGGVSFIINGLAGGSYGGVAAVFFTRPHPKICHSEPLISGLNPPPPVTTVTAFLPLNKVESAIANV